MGIHLFNGFQEPSDRRVAKIGNHLLGDLLGGALSELAVDPRGQTGEAVDTEMLGMA